MVPALKFSVNHEFGEFSSTSHSISVQYFGVNFVCNCVLFLLARSSNRHTNYFALFSCSYRLPSITLTEVHMNYKCLTTKAQQKYSALRRLKKSEEKFLLHSTGIYVLYETSAHHDCKRKSYFLLERGRRVMWQTHTTTFKNMLVHVPPKRRAKIHDVTSQKTVRNLVCCYVYINLINVRLVLTRRIKWTGIRLRQAREDKNTQKLW